MRIRDILLAVVMTFCVGGISYGQAASTATILGRVSDISDAALPNASVTIVNTVTGASRKLQTNQSGEYTLPGLKPGPYKVTVELQGFCAQVGTLTVVVAWTISPQPPASVQQTALRDTSTTETLNGTMRGRTSMWASAS